MLNKKKLKSQKSNGFLANTNGYIYYKSENGLIIFENIQKYKEYIAKCKIDIKLKELNDFIEKININALIRYMPIRNFSAIKCL